MKSGKPNYSPADMMSIQLARLLPDGENVFHGLSSPIPMVAILLAKRLYTPQLVYLNIAGGIDPKPRKLYTSSVHLELLRNSSAYFSLTEIFDLSARGRLDNAFLSGAQIDQYGNINNSVIGSFTQPKVRLPGGAGSAVIIPTAKRTIVWRTKHDRRTMVEKCDFITSTGNVSHVVTPLAIFRKEGGRLVVESIHPHTTVDYVQEHTGFPLIFDQLRITKEPTRQELFALNQIDPGHVREIEFS